jgi:hypothetical protein
MFGFRRITKRKCWVEQKTAGRAVTLRSGNFNSAEAIFLIYRNLDSLASAKLWAGAE